MTRHSEDSGAVHREIYRRHCASVTSVVRMFLSDDDRCTSVVAEVFGSLQSSPELFNPDRATLLSTLRLGARTRSIAIVLTDLVGAEG